MSSLGRLEPPDWEHIDKYPLAALGEAAPTQVPIALSINWYSNFDNPVRDADGNFWIGRGDLGGVRGGHCVCIEPKRDSSRKGGEVDNSVWWPYYNQGQEGSCVGHGTSRVMSLINRKRYDAVWLYREAQAIDGFPLPHEGTTGRAAMEILRARGNRVAHGSVTTQLQNADRENPAEGIAAYRWATSVEEVLAALGTPQLDYITILNSWGTTYPHRVRMPAAALARVLAEQGEAGVVTDR